MTIFTTAQRRALLWLPANGSWVTRPFPRKISGAVDSLCIYHRDLVETDYAGMAVCLTPPGIEAARKELERTQV